MRRVPKLQMTAASALLIGVFALSGCASEVEPQRTPTPAVTTATPTPTPSADGALPAQDAPTTSDATLALATALIDEFLPVNLKISTEAAPAESVAEYIVEGSPAESRIADTVRLNKEYNAGIEGDGQFRWMTYYQGSYAAPLEDPYTGETIEFGSAYIQGCLYNEGLTYTLDGKPDPSVSTEPTRRQYTVDFDTQDSRWKIQNIENLPEATFPC